MKNELICKFVNRKISNIDECNDCEFNKICFLGCPATNILENDGQLDAINKKPDYCIYFESMIEEITKVILNHQENKLIR